MSQQSNNVSAGMGNPATRSNNVSSAPIIVNAGGPTGSLGWIVARTYDFTLCSTSGPYTSPTTITTGGGLPNLTFATDAAGTYSVTPTNGVGIQLSNTGAGRPYISFIPDWAGIGIDPLKPDGWAVEIQINSPVTASSSFFSTMVGSSANPNGSGSGAGGRYINTAGNRNLTGRSYSSGTSELSSILYTAASDYASFTTLGAAYAGEMVSTIINTAMPASPDSYILQRDGFTRTIGTTWGLSPGHVSILFGGATLSGTLVSVKISRRGVV